MTNISRSWAESIIASLVSKQKDLDEKHKLLEHDLDLTENQKDVLIDLMYNFKYDQNKIDNFLDEVYGKTKCKKPKYYFE